MIVQYNQREGRRIAAMAAQEINKKKEENKRYLDQQVALARAAWALRSEQRCRAQVQEHERRRKKEERAKLEFIREQKERLRRLEEEEARKDVSTPTRLNRPQQAAILSCVPGGAP